MKRRNGTQAALQVLRSLGLVAGITLLVFFLVRVVPGDLVDRMALEGGLGEQEKAALREELGLAGGWLQQLGLWVERLLSGDLGQSLRFHRPITDLLLVALVPTVMLASLSFLFGLLLGTGSAVGAALWPRSFFPALVNLLNVWSITMPTFCVGLLGILVFVLWLGWMPLLGNMLLPVVIIGLDIAGQIAKPLHEELKEAGTASFVRTARAKGLGPARIVLFHILPNSLSVLLALINVVLAGLIGGTITMEVLFALPGLGKLALDAVLGRDYPLIQAVILFIAVGVVLINLASDLAARLVDPRLRQ